MTVTLSDVFSRTVAAGGWGSSTSGTTWTSQPSVFSATGYANAASVSPGAASIASTTALPRTFMTQAASYTDLDMVATFNVSILSGSQIDFCFRSSATGAGGYYLQAASGTVLKFVNSTTFATIATVAKTYNASTDYTVRMVISGSTFKARLWLTSGSEPSTWDLSTTDTNFTSGIFGIYTTQNNGATTLYKNIVVGTDQALLAIARSAAPTNSPMKFRGQDSYSNRIKQTLIAQEKSLLRAQLNARVRIPLVVRSLAKTATRSQASTRTPHLVRNVGRFLEKASVRLVLLSKPVVAARSRVSMQVRTLSKAVLRSSAILKALVAARNKTPARSQFASRSPMKGSMLTKSLTIVRTRFTTQARFLEKSLLRSVSRSKMAIVGRISTRTQTRFSSRSPLKLMILARFLVVQRLKSVLRSKVVVSGRTSTQTRTSEAIRAPIKSLARSRFSPRMGLASQLRARSVNRARLTTLTRPLFRTLGRIRSVAKATFQSVLVSRLYVTTRTRYTISNRLRITNAVRFNVKRLVSAYTLMFVTFSEIGPVGNNRGIKPYTTIATQLLVVDQNGSPVNGLQQCNVQVTDPVGNVTLSTLADTIQAIVGGKYWCIYNTGIEGVYTELWTLIAPDGVEIASYKNIFRAEY